jgi:hypothetical protein
MGRLGKILVVMFALTAFVKGQTVALKGQVKGYSINVEVKGCTLQ